MWVMVTGYGGSGKDTIADYVRYSRGTDKMAFADPLREFCTVLDVYFPQLEMTYNQVVAEMGYESAKQCQCVRDHLVRVGHGARTALWQSIWIDCLEKKASQRPGGGTSLPLVIPDGRYNNEVETGRKRGNSVCIRVRRKGCKAKHDTEKKSIKEIVPDFVVRNDGTKGELYEKVDAILNAFKRDPIRIYVAGSSVDRVPVRVVQRTLIEHGFVITHDWTSCEAVDPAGPETPEERGARWARYGEHDLKGVMDAEYVVLVFTDPDYAYRGTCTELGIALGSNKKIIALHVTTDSVFVGGGGGGGGGQSGDSKAYLRNPFMWIPQVRHFYCTTKTLEDTVQTLPFFFV